MYPLADLSVFRWLYAHGLLLVDLFFILSGIIFTARYLGRLATGQVSGRNFFVLRFSRLYPAHIVTLVACAAVEWTLMWVHRTPVVYGTAGLYDFVLQALYLNIAFFRGWAFNGPTWSVSAEILAYASFFLLASRYRKNYVALSIVIFLIALSIVTTRPQTEGGLLMINGALARGFVGFYLGSLGYLAMRKVEEAGHGKLLAYGCLAWFAIIVLLGQRLGYDAWIGADPAVNCVAVFPPLVFASLGVRPLASILSVRPLRFLGDISYSIYLVHIPVQMTIIAIASTFSISLPITKPLFFAGYAATVMGVGTLVRYGIEKPASRWLRSRFVQAPVAEAPARAAAVG